MNDCRDVGDRLAAYADESLGAAERDAVERHLTACAACRGAAARQREAHRLLRVHAGELRNAPLPPGLRSRCEAIAREHSAPGAAAGWRAYALPVALAAMLIVFTAAALLSLATRRSDAVLAAQLSADHSRCFRNFVTASSPDLEAQQVERMLAAEYGWDLHVPPSSQETGVQLIHARRCLYADGRIPHILYRAHGQELSLFILEGVTRAAADVVSLGNRSRMWSRGATTFVLVSSAGAGELDQAARYVMQEAR